MRPYTRSLDPADYSFLPHAERLRAFEAAMTAPHCVSHAHKLWENASIVQQLEELDVSTHASLIDVGSGGMFFPPYLAAECGYKHLTLTDSMDNREIFDLVAAQCKAYGISMPVYEMRAEAMNFTDNAFDVVMCISTIEHIAPELHERVLQELCRIVRPGGFLFITSDYFRSVDGRPDPAQIAASPYRDGQPMPYCKEVVLSIPDIIPVEFVGETDLDYRGDFVHNYSFVNICLRKRSQHPLPPRRMTTEKVN